MKKFFAIAFIAASLVACNEAEKTTETSTTTTDTNTVITPVAADTNMVIKDSTVTTTVTTDTMKKSN